MKIIVLAGGLSPERDVSLSSGTMIANSLMGQGHQVLLVDLFLGVEGVSQFDNAYQRYRQSHYSYQIPATPPDLAKLQKENQSGALVGPNVLALCQSADLTFLAVHGATGENGQIQAMLDLHHVKYTGSGYRASLLAMDKLLSKQLMANYGIQTPTWIEIQPEIDSPEAFLPLVTFPCVLKPVSGGSSIGVSLIPDAASLEKHFYELKQKEGAFLIEQQIIGREFSIGILGQQTLPAIEVLPVNGFYDYQNKYQAGMAYEICPAEISPELAKKLAEEALKVHQLLGLTGYSRIDFMVDQQEQLYCLEANTLPGMTPTSLLPQEAQAVGISYDQLCQTIMQLV